MALTKIGTDGIKDDAVTVDKITNSINAERTANTAKRTISAGSIDTVDLADEGVTLAKLEHGTPSNDGKFLRANNGADPSFETIAQPDLTNLSASNLTSGTIPDARFPATLPAVSGANLTGIAGIPSGVIAIWSGATSAIPSGWVICDGNNSTPDLRDRFVVGASDSTGDTSYPGLSVGATGGASSTNTQVSVNGNTGWASQVPNASSNPNAAPEPRNSRDRHQHGWGGTFTTSSFGIMPPYYALAYIMKT